MDLWENLRTELRRARGQNLLRARQVELPGKRRIRLRAEDRNRNECGRWLTFQVGPTLAETSFQFGGKRWKAADFDDLAAFVRQAAALCRGESPYIRTDDAVAAYKMNWHLNSF